MKILMVALLSLNGFTVTQALAKDLPVIGIDEQGKVVEEFVPEVLFKDRLTSTIRSVQNSTAKAISKQSFFPAKWMLRSVVVGIGVNMEIKAGPIIKLGALPRFRIAFTNAVEPSVP